MPCVCDEEKDATESNRQAHLILIACHLGCMMRVSSQYNSFCCILSYVLDRVACFLCPQQSLSFLKVMPFM